jgi:diketogulonate reductase-like aldo/keto reductase
MPKAESAFSWVNNVNDTMIGWRFVNPLMKAAHGEAAAVRHGLTPRARIVPMATAGVTPRIMGIGPAPATEKLLASTCVGLADIAVIEVNEAFAAQGLAVLCQLGIADNDPRRCDRARPSARHVGRATGADGDRGASPKRRAARYRDDVHRGRPGHRHTDRTRPMRHRLLGRSTLRVSELCLGPLTFGERKRWGASDEDAAAILATFADAGGTFIDTAPNYAGGAAEQIVGRFIAGRRDDFVVAAKFTASARPHALAGGNGRKAMVRSVKASLTRLGTDQLDLLRLHYWDGTAPLDEILRALDDLTHAGKISQAVTIAELRGWAPIVATQLEYNVAARTAERELPPMANALDLGLLCWGPLAAGALTNDADPQRLPATKIPATTCPCLTGDQHEERV